MPWSPAQHRLFEWAAHDPKAAHKEGYDLKQKDAARMAGEGIKHDPKALAKGIRERAA